MSKTLSYREFYTYIYMSLFSYIIDARLVYLRESLGRKRRFLSTDFKIYFRVNSGQK
jgi:hypothetical protein